MRERTKRWADAHPDTKAAHKKAYAARHPDRVAVQRQRRRDHNLGLEHSLTADEWNAIVASYAGRCAYCGAADANQMDHVIPCALGGGTIAANVVPACGPCNRRKQTRLWTPLTPEEVRNVA